MRDGSQISDRTMVPIGWLIAILATTVPTLILCAIKVTMLFTSIDSRLARLEEHAGLPAYGFHMSFENEAKARER